MKQFIILLIVLLIIDIIWLNLVMIPRFNTMITKIQGSPIQPNLIGFILSYLTLALGLYYFGYLRIEPYNLINSILMNAGLFGLASFAIFDFTNFAIFKHYSFSTALLDIMWGGIVSFLTVYITYYISKNININFSITKPRWLQKIKMMT